MIDARQLLEQMGKRRRVKLVLRQQGRVTRRPVQGCRDEFFRPEF